MRNKILDISRYINNTDKKMCSLRIHGKLIGHIVSIDGSKLNIIIDDEHTSFYRRYVSHSDKLNLEIGFD
jgi:hypothetical protein